MDKKKIKVLVLIGIIIAIILTIGLSIPFIKYIDNPQKLESIIESTGVLAPLAFFLLSMIQIIIPFIPGEPFELLAGYMFGSFEGSLLCFLAGSLSSIIIIVLVRKYGTKLVELFFKKEEHERLNFLKTKKAFLLYSLIFILPGTPKDLLCYIGGLTDFDLIPLLIVTTVGRIPGIVTSTIPADIASEKKYLLAIIIYGVTIVLSIISLLIYSSIQKKKDNSQKEKS